jgi:cytochrome c-type biogenesis protein CcmH
VVISNGISVQVAFAQSDAPAAVVPNEITPDEVNNVARELWCPLCSGVRLDACELKACDQMKDVIALKLAEGEDTEAIQAYFVEQYGPQVMGEPPRQGFNLLAWILPVVAVIFGGVFFWRTARRMVQPEPEPVTPTPAVIIINGDDEYSKKLDEELAKHG